MADNKNLMKWRFCSVCRRNHEQGRKHIFTASHKTKLSVLMAKFVKKVRAARRCLGQPNVIEGELEPGAGGKMWCYCCEQEVNKHVTNCQISIEWAGMLEHMTGSDHHRKTRRYWWLHGVDPSKLQTFLLFAAEYEHFKRRVRDALSDLEERKKERRQKLAVKIKVKEEERSLVAMEPPAARKTKSEDVSRVKKSAKAISWAPHLGSASVMEGSPKFTAITPKILPGVTGNVHTGATPPWLRNEDCEVDEDEASQIGPSLNNFILHREKQKRAKRNPMRVGADFHIKLATQRHSDSDDWLPSFGRVWNAGSRFQSKEEFLREVGGKTASVAATPTPTATPTAGRATRSEEIGASSSGHHEYTSLQKEKRPFLDQDDVDIPAKRLHIQSHNTSPGLQADLSSGQSEASPAGASHGNAILRPVREEDRSVVMETGAPPTSDSSELVIKPYVRQRKTKTISQIKS